MTAFIVLEGIDGAGTTTQARRLVDALTAMGVEALLTQEPTKGETGRLIRRMLQQTSSGNAAPDWATLALLFAADRREHARCEIEPALSRGTCVVSDRYDLSSLIYQSATAPAAIAGNEEHSLVDWLRAVNWWAPRPNLTIVLDVPADVAERRRAGRSDVDIFETSELQRKLAAMYRQAGDFVPKDCVAHVDGERNSDDVHAGILGLAQQYLSPGLEF